MSPRFRFNHQQLKTKLAGFLWKHWLDLIVVGVIITALATLLWLRSQRQTQWLEVQIKVTPEEWWWQDISPDYWYARSLQVGAKSQNSFGETVAEVTKTELTDVGLARNQVQIWAKLKVSYDSKKDQYIFGFQPLQIGRALELNFGSQQVRGLVLSMDQEPPQFVERMVSIKLSQIEPKAADALVVGLENRNSEGDVLAKITQLQIRQTIRSEYSDIRGKMIQVSDPNYVQVEAVIRMRLFMDGDRYILPDSQSIKIGGETTLQFPQTILPRALILDIKPVLPQ